MAKKNPRLQFTDAELNPKLRHHARRAGKAADQAERARAKLPKDKKKRRRRMTSQHMGPAAPGKRLYFEEVDKPKPPSKLSHAVQQAPAMEDELRSCLDNFERTHDYDEYHYDLDAIEHDPYVLISLLTAYQHGGWTLAEASSVLSLFFDRQYRLTEDVTTETRYDSDGQPYPWSVCTVTLDNFDLAHLTAYLLDEPGLQLYAGYMANQGNRPDLFPQDEYPNASGRGDYMDYDVPPEALEDETFAAMLKEAEKYLGYPYVFGGSSPATSFDCSGFVSWVLNHSGWDVGRLGAQGLYHICTPVSPANAKPGDLVFFKYTYKAPDPDGVTHCGIYVGNHMMLHCGDPISYTNLNNPYWQDHFFQFGRLP